MFSVVNDNGNVVQDVSKNEQSTKDSG